MVDRTELAPIATAVGCAFAVLFVWLMVRRPSDHSVAAFAKSYAVSLTSRNVEQLRTYIQWSRRWRLSGVVAFAALVGVLDRTTESNSPQWWLLAIGYSAGSLVGELLRPDDRPPDVSIATLTRRGVGDYVTMRFSAVVGAVFVASLVPAAYLLLTNPQRPWIERANPPGSRPQDWFVIALAALSCMISLTCWLAARSLAQAPAPADTPDRQAARHAIRSSAIISVIGGATMIIGSIGIKLCSAANTVNGYVDDSAVMSWLLALCTVACMVGTTWGAILTLTTIPRLAPFIGRLPTVPQPGPQAES